MSKTIIIRLNKHLLDTDIDQRTFKRSDAAMPDASAQTRNAASSDSTEAADQALLLRYRDHRDARLRRKLRQWLVPPTVQESSQNPAEFTNVPSSDTEYVYTFSVDDNFTSGDMDSVTKLMHEYIIRGVLYDWYIYAGIKPMDDEDALEKLEEDIKDGLNGNAGLGTASNNIYLLRTATDGTTYYLLTISRKDIAKEVAAVTRKFADISDAKKSGKAIANQTTDIDRDLIYRFAERWDASLKMKLRFCLCPLSDIPSHEIVVPTDALEVYFRFAPGFESGVLSSVHTLMQSFLVSGTLYEWYKSIGSQLGNTYLSETDVAREKIVSMLRQAISASTNDSCTLMETHTDGKKVYLLSVVKESVIDEVAAVTRKHTDTAERAKKETVLPDSVASDNNGEIDRGLISRRVQKWYAELRSELRFCLFPATDLETATLPIRTYETLDYLMLICPPFDVELLPSVTTLVHDYLVSGALYEWYKSLGSTLGEKYLSEAIASKDKVVSMLRQAISAQTSDSCDLIETHDDGEKVYLMSIVEKSIIEEVAAITRKYNDASERRKDVVLHSTIAADHNGSVDTGLISRRIKNWYAKLRSELLFCLFRESDIQTGTIPTRSYTTLDLLMHFCPEFDELLLPNVTTLVHEYLVNGALYEWYEKAGSQQAVVYGAKLQGMQEEIVSILRGPSIVKRPMQPFGPAYQF